MPSSLVTASWTVPVSRAVIVILAPVTTAPCWSVTRPVTVAMETACACSAGGFPSVTKVSSRVLTATNLLDFVLDITRSPRSVDSRGGIIYRDAHFAQTRQRIRGGTRYYILIRRAGLPKMAQASSPAHVADVSAAQPADTPPARLLALDAFRGATM